MKKLISILAASAASLVLGLSPLALAQGAGSLSWGNNSSGQLGNGTIGPNGLTPQPILLNGQIGGYSAGNQSSYAFTTDGAVWAWGDNSSGELGTNANDVSESGTPISVAGLCPTCGGVTQLASGENNAFALFANGVVQAWGKGTSGALGNGKTSSSATPVNVKLVGTGKAIAVSAGGQHGMALMSDGTVEAWGQNNKGQLGNGSTSNSKVPIVVPGISNAVAVSAANLFSMALLANGTVMEWGYNAYGQLGNGTTTDSHVPVQVTGLTQSVTSISAGGNLSSNGSAMAVMADGTVMAWGNNDSGQLGNNSTVNSSIPVVVQGLSGVQVVSAGGVYSTALLTNGTVYVWGSNSQGQMGNGTSKKGSPTPKQVPNLSGITLLSAGPPGQILVY